MPSAASRKARPIQSASRPSAASGAPPHRTLGSNQRGDVGVGIGEGVADIRPFMAAEFVDALLEDAGNP